MAKKTNIEGIDENFIINSFRQDDLTLPPSARATESPTDAEAVAPEPMPPEEQREEPRRRKARNKEQDYGALFLKEATIPARIGKTVYIRKEYHERIQLIPVSYTHLDVYKRQVAALAAQRYGRGRDERADRSVR